MTPAQLRPLPVFAALLGAGAATWSTWPPLVHTWLTMADYQHGGLLALFLLAWAYERAAGVPGYATRVPLPAALLLLGALLAWLVAYRAVSSIGQQVMIPIVLWLAVWTGCGLPAARQLAAPIACLYFAIPVWEALLPVLQRLTVTVTETTLGWLGVPVAINGMLVTIPEGTFEISQDCAGKRYLIVALAVAAVFAGTMRLRPRRALVFLGITAALALVANWLRVMIVVYAGHLTDMDSYLVTHEHLSLGWGVFALLVAVVCLIGWRLTPLRATRDEAAPPAAEARRAAASFPRSGLAATLSLLCLPFAAQIYVQHLRVPPGERFALPLPQLAGWRGPQAPDAGWAPHYVGAAAETRAAYEGAAGEVQVFVAEYPEQRPGAKLISYDNLLTGPAWVQLRAGALDASQLAGAPAPGALWVVTPRGQPWIVSYVYQIDRAVTASPVLAQLAYGTLAWSGPRRSRLVATAAPCSGSCEAAQRSLIAFWSTAGRELLR